MGRRGTQAGEFSARLRRHGSPPKTAWPGTPRAGVRTTPAPSSPLITSPATFTRSVTWTASQQARVLPGDDPHASTAIALSPGRLPGQLFVMITPDVWRQHRQARIGRADIDRAVHLQHRRVSLLSDQPTHPLGPPSPCQELRGRPGLVPPDVLLIRFHAGRDRVGLADLLEFRETSW